MCFVETEHWSPPNTFCPHKTAFFCKKINKNIIHRQKYFLTFAANYKINSRMKTSDLSLSQLCYSSVFQGECDTLSSLLNLPKCLLTHPFSLHWWNPTPSLLKLIYLTTCLPKVLTCVSKQTYKITADSIHCSNTMFFFPKLQLAGESSKTLLFTSAH